MRRYQGGNYGGGSGGGSDDWLCSIAKDLGCLYPCLICLLLTGMAVARARTLPQRTPAPATHHHHGSDASFGAGRRSHSLPKTWSANSM
jgi:hypothetical protein